MKITINMTSREVRVAESIVNKYAPLGEEAYHITANKEEEFKWGKASVKRSGENTIFTVDMKSDFVIDSIDAANEFIAPVIGFFKLMKGYIAAYKAKLDKWSKTEGEILCEVAEKSVQMYAKKWTTFIVFFEHTEDWVEVKPGTKKLKKIIAHKMIENRDDIETFAARAAKEGRNFVFLTYADDQSSITDLDGAKAFFEDHKACW